MWDELIIHPLLGDRCWFHKRPVQLKYGLEAKWKQQYYNILPEITEILAVAYLISCFGNFNHSSNFVANGFTHSSENVVCDLKDKSLDVQSFWKIKLQISEWKSNDFKKNKTWNIVIMQLKLAVA
jgi:hypothetical protein